jgi:YggT family protein
MVGIRIDPYNPVIKLLYDFTDPILNPLRRFATVGMMDLSPIIAFFLISILMKIVGTMF